MLKQPNLQVSKHKPVSSKDTNKTDSSIDAQQAETPTIKMDYREPIHMSKEILFNKYFESFNFYFSKHINEILADLALPHVILYKDYLYYDDEEEYLRRYYRADEAISRIPNLSKFYSNVEGNINKPNLAVHEQNEIILKRNSRLHELFVNKLKNFESIPKTHRDHEKPITFRVLPRPEEQTGFCEEDDSGTSYTQKKRQDVLVEDEKPNNSFQRALEAQEDMDEVSYESQEHDVYNPSPASSNTSVHGRKRIKEKISTKNSKIDNEGSDKTEVLEVQLLEGSLSAIGRSEGRDSRGSVFESLGFDQSSELLSNVSEISLIEQIFGGVPDSESKGGLIRDVENLHNKRTTRNNLPREKNLPKKLAGRTENTEKEEMKKPSRIEKNSAPKSNNAIEDKDKAQKNVVEAPENKKAAVNQQGNSKITFARKTDSSERVKTEEDRLHIRKVKVEKYSTNTQPGSSTLPLKMLDTPQKLEYWTVSHAKNNTPVKEQKMGNKSDPEVQTAPNEAKVRIQKLRRSEQQAAGKQPIPIYPQEQELREQDKYYEQICALNLPEKLFKTISHDENLRFSVSSSDMGKNETKKKSRLLTEEKAESYYREEKKQANRIEKSPEIKGFYSEQQSYLKSLNSQTKNQVSRSRTEDKTSLIKSRTEDTVTISGLQKSFTDLHKVPAKQAQSKRITSSLKVLTSFNDNQQKSARLETNSREGGSLGHILSNTTHNLKTQSSMEHTRSIRGNLSEERLTGSSSSRAPKTVSVRSLQSTMKSQGKASVPNTYSSKLHTQEISDNSTAVTRRINGQTMAAPSLSSKGHLLTNLPISPRKQINLNINLKKLSQESQSKQQDSGIDNSYGFWTSRSSRGNVNESSKKSIKESPKLPSDRGAYTDGRDYGNHPRYGSGSMTEKPSALSSRRLTKVSMYHEFKLRENEMLRSIKNLKPDYMMAMWPPASADKITVENQETKKRLSSSGKRLSTSRAVKGKKRAEGKI